MFIVYVRDYINNKTSVLFPESSYRSSFEIMYDIAIKYIYDKQGSLIDDDNLIYKKNQLPNIRGKSIYYIQKSFSNNDKIYVLERVNDYGYLYNNINIKKHLRVEICYIHDYEFNNDDWEYDIDVDSEAKFNNVLEELEKYQKEKIIPKLENESIK